jgi:hypothetical protein
MQVSVPYKSLKHTLQCLKIQVEDSLPHVKKFIPDTIQGPEQLFYFLKDLTTYKRDPRGRELLQTVQTLLSDNNKHGIPGHGDCDCFTILVLASCHYLGFGPQQVAIVGNSKLSPSHIYSLVYDPAKKKMCSMDLTNPYYDMQRPYHYKQTLNFMMLELRDNGFFPLASKAKKAARKQRKQIRQAGKTARVTARVAKRTARSENKTARKIATQERRTDRRVQKGERKAVKREKKTARQEKGLIKVKGRQEIIKARQLQKLNNVMSPEASWDNEFEPGADNIIMPQTSTSNYEADSYEEQLFPGEEQYDEFEMLPEDTEEEFYEEEELSAPFLPFIISGIKKAVSKAKQAAGKVNASGVVSKYNELSTLKSQNKYLTSELERSKRNQLIYGIGGTVTGVVIGVVLPKLFKK